MNLSKFRLLLRRKAISSLVGSIKMEPSSLISESQSLSQRIALA